MTSHHEMKADALACFHAAIQAVAPRRLVAEHLERGKAIEGPVHLAAIGKAAGTMAAAAHAVLADRLAGGVVIVPHGVEVEALSRIRTFSGGHPVPDARGVGGAEAMAGMAAALGEDDVLVVLLSGGGSSLMTLPPEGVTLEDIRQTTDLLLRAGATIQELNRVRKHMDRLKGGRLARIAAPARVLALVLSDVVGDPLDVIASGPVSPDPTTFATAIQVLEQRGLWAKTPHAVRAHMIRGVNDEAEESPTAGDPCFERVETRIIGNNRLAAEAARREAESRGYHAQLLSTLITGEAREVGRVLAALGREVLRSGEPLPRPACLVSAGETTVTVHGSGKGGRNQELVLGAALDLAGEDGIVVASAGTDGIDGPTDAAGAIADGTTLERARARGLDPLDALARNDSYPLFQALDDLIITGPTGTNVMDIQIVLVNPTSGDEGGPGHDRPGPLRVSCSRGSG